MKPNLRAHRRIALWSAAAVYLAGCGSHAMAGNIAILDPSFETPVLSPGGFTFTTGTGWTSDPMAGTPVIDYPGANQFVSVPDGAQVAILNDFNGPGTLSQALSSVLAADTQYTLTYFVGNDMLLTYDGYTAELTAGGITLASHTSVVSPTPGHFLEDTITFTSGANPAQLGQALGITFSDIGLQSVAFDDVQLTAAPASAAPEPATWSGAALVILLLRLRRLRRTAPTGSLQPEALFQRD